MKWFNKWILSKVEKAVTERQQNRVARDYETEPAPYSNSAASIVGASGANYGMTKVSVPKSALESETAMQFTVHNASGGRVVQTFRYDRNRDRAVNGMYVITEDQDFGKTIDKIITMESMK